MRGNSSMSSSTASMTQARIGAMCSMSRRHRLRCRRTEERGVNLSRGYPFEKVGHEIYEAVFEAVSRG